jgi:hydrogenase expression/formation protein HypE
LATPGLGKLDRDFMRRVVLRETGAHSRSVIVGPGSGLDNAVISVGKGRVMVVTADPLTMVPAVGMEVSAWLTVHELASDIATSAVRPQFAVLDYNVPPALGDKDLRAYISAVSRECGRLGISIIGGHSGRYPGSNFTVIGGGVMMATADRGSYVTPRMIEEGDEIVMTKSAAIEATAVLALSFPETVEALLGSRVARRAAGYVSRCSTFEDSLAASSVGIRRKGVTGMHDATEGGVLGALFELVGASGKTFSVEREKIRISRESRSLCDALGLDPLNTLSEGALLVACRPERTSAVIRALGDNGSESCTIGKVGGKGGGLLVSTGGRYRRYTPPKVDPYWAVYARGIEEHWR